MPEDEHNSHTNVLQVAGLITAFSVIAAASTHVYEFGERMVEKYYPTEDIRLLAFNSRQRLVLGNRGDIHYYISDVSYHHDYDTVMSALESHSADNNKLNELCVHYYEKHAMTDVTRLVGAKESGDDEGGASVEKLERERLCAEHMSSVTERIESMDARQNRKRRWVPATKSTSIADTLLPNETKQFSLHSTEWSRCKLFNPAQGGDDAAAKMLALWVLSYHTYPGKCLTANYYYHQDPDYLNLTPERGWLGEAMIPSAVQLRYVSMSHTLEGEGIRSELRASARPSLRAPNTALTAGQFRTMDFPGIVGFLKYRDSHFCAALIKEMTGVEVAPAEPDCLQLRGPEVIGKNK